MNTYYNVEIQMAGHNKTTRALIGQIAETLGTDSASIDELEPYRAVLFFSSDIKSCEMRKIIQAILCMHRDAIHYIDVVYRYECEMTPDRFVYWSDGHMTEYIGHVIFEEEK